MKSLTRRQFSATALAFASPARRLWAAPGIAETLQTGMQKRGIPCVTAMVANAGGITYSGAFGKRDSASGVNVTPELGPSACRGA